MNETLAIVTLKYKASYLLGAFVQPPETSAKFLPTFEKMADSFEITK